MQTGPNQANVAIKVKIKTSKASTANTVNIKDEASAEDNGPTILTSTANSTTDEATAQMNAMQPSKNGAINLPTSQIRTSDPRIVQALRSLASSRLT